MTELCVCVHVVGSRRSPRPRVRPPAPDILFLTGGGGGTHPANRRVTRPPSGGLPLVPLGGVNGTTPGVTA